MSSNDQKHEHDDFTRINKMRQDVLQRITRSPGVNIDSLLCINVPVSAKKQRNTYQVPAFIAKKLKERLSMVDVPIREVEMTNLSPIPSSSTLDLHDDDNTNDTESSSVGDSSSNNNQNTLKHWFYNWEVNLMLPGNRIPQIWDYTIFIVLMYTLIIMPWRMAFLTDRPDAGVWLDIIVDSLFFIDIFVNMITPYKKSFSEFECHVYLISSKYLKSWFILDLLACLPVYLMDKQFGWMTSLAKVPRLLRTLKLLRLLKLARAYKMAAFFKWIENLDLFRPAFIRIAKLVVIIGLFTHFAACMFFFFGITESDNPHSWVNRVYFQGLPVIDMSNNDRYLISCYWAITCLTTVGFGDITAETTGELLWTSITMLTGACFFAWFTGTFSNIISHLNGESMEYRVMLSTLNTFMHNGMINEDIQNQMRDFLVYLWKRRDAETIFTGNSNSNNFLDHPEQFYKFLPIDFEAVFINNLHRNTIHLCPWVTLLQQAFPSEEAALDTDDILLEDMSIEDGSIHTHFLHSLLRALVPLVAKRDTFLEKIGMHVNYFYIVNDGSLRVDKIFLTNNNNNQQQKKNVLDPVLKYAKSTPLLTTQHNELYSKGVQDAIWPVYEVRKGGTLGDIGIFMNKRWHGDVITTQREHNSHVCRLFRIDKSRLLELVTIDDHLRAGRNKEYLSSRLKSIALDKMTRLTELGFFDEKELAIALKQTNSSNINNNNYSNNSDSDNVKLIKSVNEIKKQLDILLQKIE